MLQAWEIYKTFRNTRYTIHLSDFSAGLAHLAVWVLQRAGADSGVRRPELDGVVIAASREDHLVRGHRACHTHRVHTLHIIPWREPQTLAFALVKLFRHWWWWCPTDPHLVSRPRQEWSPSLCPSPRPQLRQSWFMTSNILRFYLLVSKIISNSIKYWLSKAKYWIEHICGVCIWCSLYT